MADRRIVVDPVTRIEGHLRVQAVLGNGGNVITDSQSTGTMWRGLEVILKGRDPRDAWAFVERICGFAPAFTLWLLSEALKMQSVSKSRRMPTSSAI